MPAVKEADAAIILDHVVGDPSVPAATAQAFLANLPFPSVPTPRLARAVLLRFLADDPVSKSSLKTIHLLASLPASPSATASPIAAAYIAVAAFLAASAPDFDATARELFARRAVDEGTAPALASDDVIATLDQFQAAVGNPSSQTILRGLWGNRVAAEERVRDLLAAEWAAIGPSKLVSVAELIVGDGAVETWRAADEPTRAKLRILAGEENTREILGKLEEPTSSPNPISTPAVKKVIDVLKTSCADLHSVVEDALPAVDEILAANMDKGVSLNADEVRGQPTTCGAAGPSTINDKDQGPIRGKPSPRRLPPSPLQPPENKSNRRRRRKWSLFEQETLRKGVEQYGAGNWKGILDNNSDVFIGRTSVDLKDKWRTMNPFGHVRAAAEAAPAAEQQA